MVCVPAVGPFTHYSHYHLTAHWEDYTEEFASETPNCDRSTSASPLVITTRLRELRMRAGSDAENQGSLMRLQRLLTFVLRGTKTPCSTFCFSTQSHLTCADFFLASERLGADLVSLAACFAQTLLSPEMQPCVVLNDVNRRHELLI